MYALILAGGMGERLRPLTDTIPKPMVPISEKPILWHQIQWLRQAGVTDVVFLVGYRWQAIQEYFGDGTQHGFHAHYSIEDSPLGRGGAIKKGLSLVPADAETVIVLNGDIITSEHPDTLLADFHQRQSVNKVHMASIMVVPMVSPYGIVDVDDKDMVVGFREKVELPHWINAGIYVFNRGIADLFPDLGDHENETFPHLAQSGQLSALRSRAFWRSVDSFKDLREAQDFVTQRETAESFPSSARSTGPQVNVQ